MSRGKLQLVGVTAMLVASKYEEMYAPEVADFVYITDNAYTKADIRHMECIILKTLDFSLGKPLCLHFLRRNSKAGQVDANKHTLAKYLMELTITEYDMVHVHPSQIAAAALCISIRLLDGSSWVSGLLKRPFMVMFGVYVYPLVIKHYLLVSRLNLFGDMYFKVNFILLNISRTRHSVSTCRGPIQFIILTCIVIAIPIRQRLFFYSDIANVYIYYELVN